METVVMVFYCVFESQYKQIKVILLFVNRVM